MKFDEKEYWQSRKECLIMGFFSYGKENGRTVAPCGAKHKCKNHHRKCDCWAEADMCERPLTAREKAEIRLFYEWKIRGRGKIKKRIRQILRVWAKEYGMLSIPCKGCTEIYCSVGGKINPRCKQGNLKNIG
jgi:hypothetical protein